MDHDLVVKTVEANTTEKWVLLYVKRWLKAPLRLPDGTLQERRKGTPQGSAVSPVLANLFLHYAFDMFLEREFPTVEFERYADDAVVHCVTERQARQVWEVLTVRLAELGLELHPGKTKIVYCGDSLRHGEYEAVTFTFLGYAFRPRQVKDKNGRVFASFTPAISPEALKAKGQIVRGWRIHMRTGTSLDELAKAINPIVAGWINYYGLFGRKKLNQLLRRVNTYLTRWARRKYKRLRSYKRFHRWWTGLIDREPGLFVHWNLTRAFDWRR